MTFNILQGIFVLNFDFFNISVQEYLIDKPVDDNQMRNFIHPKKTTKIYVFYEIKKYPKNLYFFVSPVNDLTHDFSKVITKTTRNFLSLTHSLSLSVKL